MGGAQRSRRQMSDRSRYQGNKGLEFYKAYPRDFFEGTLGFPGPLRGFYRMVLDLIYMHDGFLLDDWGHISGHTGFGKTQCKRMMDELIRREKIYVLEENERFFMQKRAVSELKDTRKFQENQSNKAAKRWENNDLPEAVAVPEGMPEGCHHETTKPRDSYRPSGSSISGDPEQLELTPDETEPPDEIVEAFDAFKIMAKRAGLPVPAKLSAARKGKLKGRIKDAGGLEGWVLACGKVEASAFCTGQNNSGWTADLDFMLQESGFAKIMEGSYDNRPHPNGPGPNGNGGRRDPHFEQMAGFAEVAAQGPERGGSDQA